MPRLVGISKPRATRRFVAWASSPMVSGLTMKAPYPAAVVVAAACPERVRRGDRDEQPGRREQARGQPPAGGQRDQAGRGRHGDGDACV